MIRTYDGTGYRAGAAVGLMVAAKMCLWNERWEDTIMFIDELENIYGHYADSAKVKEFGDDYPLTDVPFSQKYVKESIFEMANVVEAYGLQTSSMIAACCMPSRVSEVQSRALAMPRQKRIPRMLETMLGTKRMESRRKIPRDLIVMQESIFRSWAGKPEHRQVRGRQHIYTAVSFRIILMICDVLSIPVIKILLDAAAAALWLGNGKDMMLSKTRIARISRSCSSIRTHLLSLSCLSQKTLDGK